MRIVFDEQTLEQSNNASRSITGLVFFDFDGKYFPGDGWNDFAVVVAAWWLDAVDKLEQGADKEVTLHFMDGPYWIVASRAVSNTVLLQCTEDRRTAGVVHEERVDLEALTSEVRWFARQVALACTRRSLESNDVNLLRKSLPDPC